MVTDITPIGKRVFLTPINAVTWLAEAADMLVTEDLQKKKKKTLVYFCMAGPVRGRGHFYFVAFSLRETCFYYTSQPIPGDDM